MILFVVIEKIIVIYVQFYFDSSVQKENASCKKGIKVLSWDLKYSELRRKKF